MRATRMLHRTASLRYALHAHLACIGSAQKAGTVALTVGSVPRTMVF